MLLLSIDDLNDWTGCLGGHPQAKTLNIDRLAKRGTLFANAHCQSPVCNPSRASLMTWTTSPLIRRLLSRPRLKASPSSRTPRHSSRTLAKHGYKTLAAGKLFHTRDNRFFEEYGGSMGGLAQDPRIRSPNLTGIHSGTGGYIQRRMRTCQTTR